MPAGQRSPRPVWKSSMYPTESLRPGFRVPELDKRGLDKMISKPLNFTSYVTWALSLHENIIIFC